MVWEAQFLLWLQELRVPFWDVIMKYVSLIGDHGVIVIAVGLLLLIFKKTRRTGCQVLLALTLTFIVGNLIIKNVVGRVRPYDAYAYLIPAIAKPHDTSFPSGHSSSVFAGATAIFLNHKKAGIAALAVAALIAFSRLYNGVHYPTDVLAGAALGIVFAILVYRFIFPACEKGVNRLKARKAG